MAKSVIDYLVKTWETLPSLAARQVTAISFYGGEPLLNFSLIQQVVDYIKAQKVSRHFVFSLTSNCVLLDRYMDYLADNDFILLCSLDGDKDMDGYRVHHDGSSSFDRVFSNIKKLQEKYPDYFNRNVSFNAVLHNLNSVQGICAFIQKEFGKIPVISELSSIGVRPEKKKQFTKAFKNYYESLYQAENYDELSMAMIDTNPDYHMTRAYIESKSGNVFPTYNELLSEEGPTDIFFTGTCVPFAKKMFIKVDGKIMPCEHIPHSFYFGYVKDGEVHIDEEEICNKFNHYLDQVCGSCVICARRDHCLQCVYQIDGIETDRPHCHGFMTENQEKQYCAACRSYLYDNPQLYRRMLFETVYE
jgi:uncharacterized protein